MKWTFIFLMVLLSTMGFNQVDFIVSDPVSVTNGDDSFGRHHPRIFSLENGNLLVFWSKGGLNSGLFFSIFENEQFSEPVEISTANITPNIWGGGLGPEMAVFENHIYVTFEVYGEAIYCIHSNDGGLSFNDPVAAFIPPPDRHATLPSITINLEGHPIISYVNTDTSEQDARYETVASMDFGQTFLPPVNSSANAEGTEVCECCPGTMTFSNNGGIALAFRNNNNNVRDIWLVKSSDNAESFPVAVDMDQTDWNISACPASGPHILNNGTHTVSTFFSGGNDTWDSGVYAGAVNQDDDSAELIKSLPGINEEGHSQNFPRLAGVGDTIAVVWHETYNNSREIAMNVSTSGYEGLASQATLNVSDASLTQSYPDAVYSGGKFHVVYEDVATNTVLYQNIALVNSTDVHSIDDINISVFPNPVEDVLNVLIPSIDLGVVNIKMIDLLGRVIFEQKVIEFELEIPVQSLNRGLYILHCTANGQTVYSERIIKP